MINQIQEDTGADISIEDDGTVLIGATTGEAAEHPQGLPLLRAQARGLGGGGPGCSVAKMSFLPRS